MGATRGMVEASDEGVVEGQMVELPASILGAV
jgi:hypothetical protein